MHLSSDRLAVVRDPRGSAEGFQDLRVCCDTGGTFTDLIVDDVRHGLRMFKSATTPARPSAGILNVLALAAADRGEGLQAFLGKITTFVHGTTHAVNAIVTGSTGRTALLVTEGHPEILTLREGGRVDPFDHRIPYPAPYVPRRLTFEIPGRFDWKGQELRPFDDSALIATAEICRREGVEAIAVCFLWSIVNPAHELRAEALLREAMPGVPLTLSHRLNPTIREYRRAISTAIDASLKPLMDRYLGSLEQELRAAGLDCPILIVGSDGNMLEAGKMASTPIRTINSGPAMAPISGRHYAGLEGFHDDVIVVDTGGTTFDVSVVRNGEITNSQVTWLGRPFASDITGFPSLEIKSIGSGGGSIAWVDGGGVLRVGPRSTGAVPGPACYGRQDRLATVTDAAVVLGLIDADYFLGGKMKLDASAARRAVENGVAKLLGVTAEAASAAIIEVLNEDMVQAIDNLTTNVGIDPAGAALVGGGGAIGINAGLIMARLRCRALILPDVGAALSASGGLLSTIGSDFRQPFFIRTDLMDTEGAAQGLAALRKQAEAFFEGVSVPPEARQIAVSVEARYIGQSWEIEIPLDETELEDVAGFVAAFHKAHASIFSVHDPASAVEIITLIARARCLAEDPVLRTVTPDGNPAKTFSTRAVHIPGHGRCAASTHHIDALAPNIPLTGPAIIETPFTSIVVPPSTVVVRSTNGNLVMRPLTHPLSSGLTHDESDRRQSLDHQQPARGRMPEDGEYAA